MRSIVQDLPLAANGLTSYRYRGPSGWIMIGAYNNKIALREADRSMNEPAIIERLQVWDGKQYVKA